MKLNIITYSVKHIEFHWHTYAVSLMKPELFSLLYQLKMFNIQAL